jgi:hypothetical protein
MTTIRLALRSEMRSNVASVAVDLPRGPAASACGRRDQSSNLRSTAAFQSSPPVRNRPWTDVDLIFTGGVEGPVFR